MDNFDYLKKKKHNLKPRLIFYLYSGFVLFSFLLTYLVDAHNFLGLRDFMIDHFAVPLFWFHWFRTPVEIPVQWYTLGAAVLIFIINAGIALERKDKDIFRFWFLLSAGIILMFVEDAGDVRHAYREHIETIFGEGFYGLYSTLYELLYFIILGAFMLYVIIKFRAVYREYVNTRKYLLRGYILYGVAVTGSWLGSGFEAVTGFSFYSTVGEFILNRIFIIDGRSEFAYRVAQQNYIFINRNLMDRAFEESLELLAAASLLTAALYFFSHYRDKTEKNEHS